MLCLPHRVKTLGKATDGKFIPPAIAHLHQSDDYNKAAGLYSWRSSDRAELKRSLIR